MQINSSIKQYKIPWAAWHEKTHPESSHSTCGKYIAFPEFWKVERLDPQEVQPLTSESIAHALDNPKGCAALSHILHSSGKRVVVAIDDLTRPACLEPVINTLLDKLQEIGFENERIRIIIAVAAHRRLNMADLVKKLGKRAASTINVINHDPESEMEDVIWAPGKTFPINRLFMSSDFKMTISTVTPHFYAGYSGGAKIILPGLAGIDAIVSTHKSVLMGLSGKLREIEGNRFRRRIELVARAVGVDYSIQIIVGFNREIVGLYAGDIVSAHREAVKHGEEIYAVDFPKDLDVVVLNAYPKDTELLQSENAFIAYRSAKNLVKPGGTIVLTSACSEGIGVHGLFQPGKMLYRDPRPYRFLEDRHLIVFAPGVSEHDFYSLFFNEYSFHQEWSEVVNELKQRHSNSCRIGIIPYASLQMSKDVS